MDNQKLQIEEQTMSRRKSINLKKHYTENQIEQHEPH